MLHASTKWNIGSEYYHSFMYTQIIKVYDSVAPVVTGIRDTFCTSPTACTANITKVVTIKDNCTDEVKLEQRQLMIAPNQTTDAGLMILYSTPRWSTKALGNGQFEITVTGLPEGTHDLIVVGRDECGNLSVATRIPFVVKDCKAPAPICINGLSTELMPNGAGAGMMTVWANDFVASDIYDCNGQGPETKDGLKLVKKYSINRVGDPVDQNKTALELDCADAGENILVEIHAWDEAGNHDFCITFIEVQDNRKVCPTGSNIDKGEISGIITTDDTEPLAGVNIEVSGGTQLNQNSSNNGTFSFAQLQKGSDFTVAAQMDKDHLNGVSTFDLVILQKHILGVQSINNPYRLIAADVNNSKSISTLDMIQIRKLILNLDDRFKNVASWRFVDATYKFTDQTNPWAETFPEVVNVNDLAGKVQANFIAIKMGDVNGSASVSSAATSEVRGAKAMILQTDEQALKTGQTYAVAIRAKDLHNIQGYQFTLQVDPALATIDNIEYNGVMKAEHFGFFPLSGQITTSFVRAPLAGATNTTLVGDDVLFTIHLKAESNIALSEVLNINSRLTPQEAYGVQDELMDVKLAVSGVDLSDNAALYQNTPNPFVDQTAIDFYLPKASTAVLTIRDVKGALLYQVEGNYTKGNNQVILKQEQLRASGVLYYTLETSDFTRTMKMVLLNK
nr:T9SS type A sorting domain-containing protein [Haliscomenobacter sp.]